MTDIKKFISTARSASPVQRRTALAALVGLLLVVPSLPVLVTVPAAAVLVWISAHSLLVGMGLGALLLHRHRKAGAR